MCLIFYLSKRGRKDAKALGFAKVAIADSKEMVPGFGA